MDVPPRPPTDDGEPPAPHARRRASRSPSRRPPSASACLGCLTRAAPPRAACGHSFCTPCLRRYLAIRVAERRVLEIACPASRRCSCLTREEAAAALRRSDRPEFLSLCDEARAAAAAAAVWCSRPRCTAACRPPVLDPPPRPRRHFAAAAAAAAAPLAPLAAESFAPLAAVCLALAAACALVAYDARRLHAHGVRRKSVCDECGFATCADCRSAWHPGESCERAAARTLQGWCYGIDGGQCTRCRSFIERVDGCNHMSCLCGFEFCWLCGSPWESTSPCECPIYGGARKPDFTEWLELSSSPPLPTKLWHPFLALCFSVGAELLVHSYHSSLPAPLRADAAAMWRALAAHPPAGWAQLCLGVALHAAALRSRAPLPFAHAMLLPGTWAAWLACLVPVATPLLVSFAARAAAALTVAAIEEFVGGPSLVRMLLGATLSALGLGLATFATGEAIPVAVSLIVHPFSTLLRPSNPRDILIEAQHNIFRALNTISDLPISSMRMLLEARLFVFFLSVSFSIADICSTTWTRVDAALLATDASPFAWYNPIGLQRGMRLPLVCIFRYVLLLWAGSLYQLGLKGLYITRPLSLLRGSFREALLAYAHTLALAVTLIVCVDALLPDAIAHELGVRLADSSLLSIMMSTLLPPMAPALSLGASLALASIARAALLLVPLAIFVRQALASLEVRLSSCWPLVLAGAVSLALQEVCGGGLLPSFFALRMATYVVFAPAAIILIIPSRPLSPLVDPAQHVPQPPPSEVDMASTTG